MAGIWSEVEFFFETTIAAIFSAQVSVEDAVITLQTHAADGGFTDLELQAGLRIHLILEAKCGLQLPTPEQLSRYLPRLANTGGSPAEPSIGKLDDNRARSKLLPHKIAGVEIAHLSWRDLQRTAEQAYSLTSGFEEKLWLRQFIEHLREFVDMERITNNLAYVVSLGNQPMTDGDAHKRIDVVERDKRYFHPIEPGWPPQTPNYLGFRYQGRLQSAHHVDNFEVLTNVAVFNYAWPETEGGDHFVYRLGPPMRPVEEIRTGSIYRKGRVWCAIDKLLSGAFRTISATRDETQQRMTDSG